MNQARHRSFHPGLRLLAATAIPVALMVVVTAGTANAQTNSDPGSANASCPGPMSSASSSMWTGSMGTTGPAWGNGVGSTPGPCATDYGTVSAASQPSANQTSTNTVPMSSPSSSMWTGAMGTNGPAWGNGVTSSVDTSSK